jgi:hypothetical protein
MYIDIENILPTIATLLVWYMILSVPAGVWVLFLTLHGKRIGRLSPDTDTQMVTIDAMAKWPKIYYLTLLAVVMKTTHYLYDSAYPEPKLSDKEAEVQAFTALFEHRLHTNSELVDYLTRDDGEGFIEIKVDSMSGTTYIALHGDPDFLESIREEDGSYDDESMKRFRSLQPWMVFDLVCAHPHYKDLLPPEIVSQISTRH